jgi:uncharacterized protein YndB with AHSA1/START domain
LFKRVTVVAAIDHPPERVFDYLSDPTKWPEFVPAVVFRRQMDDGPPRVGTRWKAIDRIGPFRLRFTDVLVACEPNHRVVWHSSSPWNSRVEYVCEPRGSGTLVRATYEGAVDGWVRVLSWAPARVIGMFLRRDFSRLDRLLSLSTAPADETASDLLSIPADMTASS